MPPRNSFAYREERSHRIEREWEWGSLLVDDDPSLPGSVLGSCSRRSSIVKTFYDGRSRGPDVG